MAGTDNIPVDIEFIFKNLNTEQEAAKIKKEIIDVGATTDKVSEQVEANFTEALTKVRVEAAKTSTAYSKGAAGAAMFAKGNQQLSYSMQQVARELPSLAISPQVFFMAISNNLPILQDQIRKTRLENEALKASGATTVPVWRQLVSSLFSWQTALVAGITIITVYGKEIYNAVRNFFSLRKEIGLTREEIKNITGEFAKSAGSELGKMQMLFDTLNNAQKGTQAYYDAKREIINQYDNYLSGLSSEITTLRDIEGAYKAITVAIIEQARQKTLLKTYEEQGQKLVDKTTQQYEELRKQLTARWGEGIGQAYFEQLRKELEAGKGLSYQMQRIVADFDKEVIRQVGGTAGTAGYTGFETITVNDVRDRINKITNAQDEFNKKVKEASALLGNLFQKLDTTPLETVQTLIERTKSQLEEAKKKLNELLQPDTKTSVTIIEDQKKLVEGLQKQLELLTGIHEKSVTTADALQKAEERLKDAVLKGDQQEIDFLAAKVVLLQKELELRRWIADEAIAYARGKVTDDLRNSILSPQPLSGKTSNPAQVGSMQNINNIPFEVVAIDKTGPVWEKIKLEIKKLAEFQNNNARNAAKEQEELDEAAFEKREKFKKDLLNYSRQITGELIDQLGLTEKQNRELQGIADIVFNLASGNWLGAAFSGASVLLTALTSGKGNQDSTAKTLEHVNNLLQTQSVILTNLSDENYFKLMAKQLDDYNKAIDLNNKKLQESHVLTKEEYERAQEFYRKQKEEFPFGPIARLTWEQYRSTLNGEAANWTPKDFIDAYTSGSQVLNEQQIEWVKSIIELQKQRADLLQETFRSALGFDASYVSDSIFSGIEQGLKLGEDSLGDFSQSFGELMKKALMQSIIDGMNIELTEGFLTKYKEFMDDGTLTPEERKKLEDIYINAVKKAEQDAENIKAITDAYTSDSGGYESLQGISRSITEETGSLLVGQFMSIRTDLKSILASVAQDDEIVQQRLAYLKTIAANTAHNARLVTIEQELKTMNKTLESKL